MSSENGYYCIWLDSHIGAPGECPSFQDKFQQSLKPMNGLPPNSINNLILCFEQEVAPIKFVLDIDDALVLVQNEIDKKIIFISSGSLGKQIIPFIIKTHPHVYTFYIFCAQVSNNLNWAIDYTNCLQMFDHETDLLIRLVRDISKEFIHLGLSYLAVYDGESARKYFTTAQTLETHANNANSPMPPFTDRLKMLQGPNGLIQESQNVKEDQRTNETIASLDNIQYVLINLTTAMNPTVASIVHFLQIFLPPRTILTIKNSSSDNIIRLINKPACLFLRNSVLTQLLIQHLGTNNLSIYMIEDNTNLVDRITHFNNIDDLINKLVELIVEKYRQQAATHLHVGQNQLADIEMKMANRIDYEVKKLRET
ncbi:unnamed protein product [Rotaria sordida]|uniref:Uncharacterized protein n=1 Tax=Rotaria sordida TaxID=392033 RepID=A0A818QXP2_9BILA|nr:unnamed protein product [Rotaria sordida]